MAPTQFPCNRCGNYTRNHNICNRCRDEVDELDARKRERFRQKLDRESREAAKRARELTRSMPYLPSEIYAEKLAAGEISPPGSSDSSSGSSSVSGSSGLSSILKLAGLAGCVLVLVPVFVFFGLFAFGCLVALGSSPDY